MSLKITPPQQIYYDKDGTPLDAGFIYIGQVSQNPETNQVAVYWDSALTLPAPQPIRTLNGYPSRQGVIANIYTASSFSITVKSKRKELVFTSSFGNSSSSNYALLVFPDYVTASTAAATLPDGQKFEVESEQKRYRVEAGALVFVENFLRSDLAGEDGSELVGYDGGTTQDVLDTVKPMASYAALRAYRGRASIVRVTPVDIAGFFHVDLNDTTSADNEGTLIVDADGRRWKRATDGQYLPSWWQIKGDGVTDDTAKLEKMRDALPAGATVDLGTGKSYLLKKTIVFTKPINLRGGSKENTFFLFAPDGVYMADPFKYGIIFPHVTTNVPGYPGDARRSSMSGFTLRMFGTGPTGVKAMLAATPIYGSEVDALGWPSDAFCVRASGDGVTGNANGSYFQNFIAYQNGGSGFVFSGDDANACVSIGCRAHGNGGWGFFDSSLLGNTFVACETDSNATGGYFTESTKPNRSSFYGCYSESNQPILWSLNPRNVRFGTQGDAVLKESSVGTTISGLPSGDAYCNHAMVFAEDDNIANASAGGALLRVGRGGMQFLGGAGQKPLFLRQAQGVNYIDFDSGAFNALRFPLAAVTGNIAVGRPFFPQGVSIGGVGKSAFTGSGTEAPTSGAYDAGAIVLNHSPAAGGKVGWVCVTAGSPGVWKGFGPIDA